MKNLATILALVCAASAPALAATLPQELTHPAKDAARATLALAAPLADPAPAAVAPAAPLAARANCQAVPGDTCYAKNTKGCEFNGNHVVSLLNVCRVLTLSNNNV